MPPDAILDSLDDGLILAGPDGRVTFHNPAAVRLLGLTGTRLTGAGMAEVLRRIGITLVPTAQPKPTATRVTAVIDGRPRTLRLRTFRVRDPRGLVVGVGHVVEDVTGTPRAVLRHRDLVLDADTPCACLRGCRIELTRTELTLLHYLMANAGTTLRHARILRHVWGPRYHDETHYVRVYVNRLRRKIEADPARPTYLLTERGIGYRFAE